MDKDIDLVKKAQNGDKEAVVEIVQRYRSVVTQKARPFYYSSGDQEDLIQEGMIALLDAIWDYKADKGTSFKSFAGLCVENRIKTVITASKRLKHNPESNPISLYAPISDDEPEITLLDSLAAEGAGPGDALITKEAIDDLGSTVKTELSDLEKKVLYCYIQGDTHKEIAAKIGKTQKAVDNAIQRIRKKI